MADPCSRRTRCSGWAVGWGQERKQRGQSLGWQCGQQGPQGRRERQGDQGQVWGPSTRFHEDAGSAGPGAARQRRCVRRVGQGRDHRLLVRVSQGLEDPPRAVRWEDRLLAAPTAEPTLAVTPHTFLSPSISPQPHPA